MNETSPISSRDVYEERGGVLALHAPYASIFGKYLVPYSVKQLKTSK